MVNERYKRLEIIQAIKDHGEYSFTEPSHDVLKVSSGFIAYAWHIPSHRTVVLKFPQWRNIEKECITFYQISNSVSDATHLVRAIGTSPAQIGDFKAILMEYADKSLDTLMEEYKDRTIPEKISLDIITQVTKGLDQIHQKGYKHRDIKPSNVLYYANGVWTISDYDNGSMSDQTQSFRGVEQYRSPELRRQHEQAIRDFPFAADIYALGITLFQCLHPSHMTVFDALHDGILPAKYDSIKDDFAQKSAIIDAELQGISPKTIRILKRMLSPELPEPVPQGTDLARFRYTRAEFLLADLLGKQVNAQAAGENKRYQEFLQAHAAVIEAIGQGEKNRSGRYNTVQEENIERIVNQHDRYLLLAQQHEVITGGEAQKYIQQEMDRFNAIQLADYKILESVMRRCIAENKGKNESAMRKINDTFRDIYEVMFLWGPDLFTNRDRKNKSEKARYSVRETRAQQTHYHAQFK